MSCSTNPQRPTHWRGVDARDFPNGEIPIDWNLINEVMAEANGDKVEAYNLFCNLAVDAREEGELTECSYLASHGLVALNYGSL
jgi:hypothetical protein